MNSKFKTIYWTFGLLFSAFVFMSNNGNPPPFRTQAPPGSASTCASSGCHSNAGNFTGDVSFTGLPSQIIPNMPYTISVTVNNTDGNATKAGFQLAAIDESTANAGTFSTPSMGSGIETNNNVEFFEHRGGQNFNAANQATWTVTWTAPMIITGNAVQFWAVGNIANGNGSTSGDNIVFNTQNFTFGAADALSATISESSNVTCNGGTDGSATVSVMGGLMPYTYAWSNGNTMATANNLAAGIYTVTVTSNNQNTTTAEVTITEPTALTTMVDVTHETAEGANDGMAMITVSGGTTPYSGAINGMIIRINLEPGNHNLTITDGNGCTTMVSYTINSFDCPIINIATTTINASCADIADGSAAVEASDGVEPYTYVWSSGGTANTETELVAGNYTVTVTDSNNCESIAMVTIEGIDLVDPTITCPDNMVMACNSVVEYDIMSEDNCGATTIEVIAGLESGAIFPLGTTLQTIQSTDLSGNTATCSFEVTVSVNDLNTDFTVTEPSCAGANDGTITLVITGGTPPYTFAGANVDFTQVSAGIYDIIVTDVNNCFENISVEVGEPTPIQIGTPTIINATEGQSNGEVNIEVSGGTGTYVYEWLLNDEVVSNEANLTNVPAGVYTLQVTDENNCTVASDEITVDNLVSIRELEIVEQLNVFPNPTTGQFVLSLALYETQNVQVGIMDVTGKELIRLAPERLLNKEFQLDLTAMAKGIYWLRILVQKEVVVRKVVVQ